MNLLKAKLIMLQLEALQEVDSNNPSNMLTLINEILRDARALAEEVISAEDKAA